MYSERIMMNFPQSLVNEPILCMVTREFDVTFNILSATITENEEGRLKVELRGTRPNVTKSIKFIKEKGISVKSLSKFITIDRELCTDCGACVVHCPTDALYLDENRAVVLDAAKCISCELCRHACPYDAVIVAHESEVERV